jgi:hypothetical protein
MLFSKKKNLLKTMMIVACLALVACHPDAKPAELIAVDARAAEPPATITTDPNLKVAFIGDSNYLAH